MRRAQLLNTAYRMLSEGCASAEAIERLSKQCDLSQRQAYRYVREAQAISAPAEVPETPVAVTLKLPRSVVDALRAHATNSGLSMGAIVSRALAVFLRGTRRHG